MPKSHSAAGSFRESLRDRLCHRVPLLPWPGWLIGLVFGLLLSLPDALVTKAYAPILGTGGLSGLIIVDITHGGRLT